MDYKEKLLINEINNIMHKKSFDGLEKAKMIQELADMRKCYVGDLAKELNCGKKELYKARKILDAPKEILLKVKNGEIEVNMVNRIMYNLKDKTKVKTVVEKVIEEDMNQVEAESYVARLNNPDMFSNQLHTLLWRFNNRLGELLSENIDIKRKEDINEMIKRLENKFLIIKEKIKC